jgi:hypothetical protein
MCTENTQPQSTVEQQQLPSGHRREFRHDHDALQDGMSRTVCDCGWQSPWRECELMAQGDYHEHVLGQLGEGSAYYQAQVVCLNCSYEGPARCVVGTLARSGTCPACSCKGELCSTARSQDPMDRFIGRR